MRRLACLCLLFACDPASEPPGLPPAVDLGADAAVWDGARDVDAVMDAALAPDRGPDAAPADAAVGDAEPTDAAPMDAAADGAPDAMPFVDACDEVRGFRPIFSTVIDRWAAQDVADPLPPDGVVFVGSSSIRRWEGLQAELSAYAPIQRGFGGSQLGEVALFAEPLIEAHAPRAVVVFAGTNDLAFNVDPAIVLGRLRCLRQRIDAARPLFVIGVTPTPSRWAGWEAADRFNRAVQDLAATEPGVIYIDTPREFLAEGQPPPERLFAADRLHLSPAGYAIWNRVVRASLEAWDGPAPVADGGPAPGTRLLIDLGPSNPEDGEPSPAPDHLGQHWNNWFAIEGDDIVLPGEHRGGLVAVTGAETGVRLTISGGFKANGRSNGGLLWPDPDRLGSLAVGSATGDFFYVEGDDHTGGLTVDGLDPDRPHRVRLFASRAAPERRVTRYTVRGAATHLIELQTSGPGAGAEDGNDASVVEVELQPDPWGRVFIDVAIAEGAFAYLSLLEIEVL